MFLTRETVAGVLYLSLIGKEVSKSCFQVTLTIEEWKTKQQLVLRWPLALAGSRQSGREANANAVPVN